MPIYSSKGGYGIENVKGLPATRKAAVKRLRAIKASQSKKKKKKY